jgi:BolA family transcriptional regulator, general stress-responsive regulator
MEDLVARIKAALKTDEVSIRDFSAEHSGHFHSPHKHSGGTHLEVSIRSEIFNDKSRVQRERLVYEIFKDELSSGRVHALVLKLRGSFDK